MTTINLDSIHSPADIRSMSIDELKILAAEMRAALIQKVSANGGHVGPNLGMVEATIALHYVFDTPKDKIIYDVSHQSYPHKMLTGRMEAFTRPEHYKDVSGFTNPDESPDYDMFEIGHTSTALSLGCGMAKARDLNGGDENIVVVCGDGSLGGGQALEGLNFGATLGSNFIVIINDNDMSIAHNHGGLYADLRLLRNSNGTAEPNIFRSFGYSYRYVHYGNDLASLIEMFKAVKGINHPVVVHINTMKGMGLPVAEAEKERFHFSAPFNPQTGTPLSQEAAADEAPDYNDIFADFMLGKMREDKNVVVLNAGTPGAIGFTESKRRRAGKQFIDVGIAEQMCVGMASGMAKGGSRPVMGVVSTFLQRAYDQLSQDVAINNQPAVFNVVYGGIEAMNDRTHLGFFDIALLSNIPRFNYLTPTCREEYLAMLDWAIRQREMPVGVRVPAGAVVADAECKLLDDYSQPAYDVVRKGGDVALIGVGSMFPRMKKAADLLAQKGIEVTLINPRSVTYLDADTLGTLFGYKLIVTAEDGIVDGGFGQKIADYFAQPGAEHNPKVAALGLPREFLDRYNPAELLSECGLTAEKVAELVLEHTEK